MIHSHQDLVDLVDLVVEREVEGLALADWWELSAIDQAKILVLIDLP